MPWSWRGFFRHRTSDPFSDVLWWIIHGGVLVALFLPLVVGSKFFFPFIVLKNVLFRSIVEVIVVAYVALAMRDRSFRPRFNPVTLAVMSFFGIAAVTTLTGIEPVWGVWGNYERMGGLFGLLHVAAFFFVIVSTFRRWEDWCSLLTTSIFVSALMSLFAFGQWLEVPFLIKSSGGSRLTGTIGNATYLAGYLLFHLFFLAYYFFRPREFNLRLFLLSVIGLDVFLVGFDLVSRFDEAVAASLFTHLSGAPRLVAALLAFEGATLLAYLFRANRYVVRVFIAGLAALNFFIFYQTETRGAFLGLLAGVLLFALAVGILRRRTVAGKISLGVVAVCLLAPVTLYLARDSAFVTGDPTLKRLAKISLADVTSQSRLDTWAASWRGWTEEPVRFLIGYGLENYAKVFNRHFPPRIFKDPGSQIWFDRAHNVIFDVGVTSGLIGLMSYLAIFGVAGWWAWHTYRRTQDIVGTALPLAVLAAYSVHNLFVFDTLESYLLSSLVLATVAFRGEAPAVPAAERSRPLPLTVAQTSTLIGVGLAAAYSLFAFNYQLLVANHKIYQALLTFPKPDPAKQRILFQQAIYGPRTGRFEARQQYATYALGLASNESVPRETVKELLQEALAELRQSAAEEPSNIRNHLFFASVANRANVLIAGAARQAIEVLGPVLRPNETRPQVYFELGQAYLINGEVERGLALYQRGLELSSHVVESYADMAIAYLLAGRSDDAFEQVRAVKRVLQRPLPVDQYQRIIRAAERFKQVPIIIALYEDILDSFPPKVEYYAGLAAAYANAGDKAKAMAAAKAALALDPGIQGQFDKFIKSLEQLK